MSAVEGTRHMFIRHVYVHFERDIHTTCVCMSVSNTTKTLTIQGCSLGGGGGGGG